MAVPPRPTYAEVTAQMIDNVRAHLAQVQSFRNDALDIKELANAVNAFIYHVQNPTA